MFTASDKNNPSASFAETIPTGNGQVILSSGSEYRIEYAFAGLYDEVIPYKTLELSSKV
jgi:hypothetical protein